MKVYISGPITGRKRYRERFQHAADCLTAEGHIAVNPTLLENVMPMCSYEDYMTIDLAILEMCDAIYMLNGWKDSPGAKRELYHAGSLGLVVMYEDDKMSSCTGAT